MKISRETRIGIFVVAVLVASFFVINYLRGKDIFGKEMQICSHYENVEGLVVSNPVYIKGYKAGSVTEVNYNPETQVFDVTCSIVKKFAIPTDTKMTIYSVDLMGGKGIRLDLGTSTEYIEDGAELAPSYATDVISSLTSRIGPLIVKATDAIDSLGMASSAINRVLSGIDENTVRSAMSHLQVTMRNVEKLSNSLAGHSDDIETLVVNLKDVSTRLVSLSEKADSSMDGVQKFAGDLGEVDVKALAVSLQNLVDNLNDPEGTIGKLTKDSGAYDSLESVLKDIDSLVKKIEENPKKYIRIRLL